MNDQNETKALYELISNASKKQLLEVQDHLRFNLMGSLIKEGFNEQEYINIVSILKTVINDYERIINKSIEEDDIEIFNIDDIDLFNQNKDLYIKIKYKG